MNRSEAGRVGGKKTAIRNRRLALKRYYSNPSICCNCGVVIQVKKKEIPYSINKRKFCSHSCAAKFNNLGIKRGLYGYRG